MRDNNAILLSIFITTSREVDFKITASECDSLRNYQVVTNFAYRFARHNFTSEKSRAADYCPPPEVITAKPEYKSDLF